MSDKLYNWLQKHFYKDNHPKYKHLFDEWIVNVQTHQILGFIKDMELEELFKSIA